MSYLTNNWLIGGKAKGFFFFFILVPMNHGNNSLLGKLFNVRQSRLAAWEYTLFIGKK